MTGYVKRFDSNMTMPCNVNDDRLLKSILRYGEQLTF